MNKIKMDEFLKYIAKIIKENPSLDLNDPDKAIFIYERLIRLGVDEKDRKANIRPLFNKWIKYYKNKENIDVFEREDWKGFCQFHNKENDNVDHIKIYVPTKSKYIEENSKIIFDCLSQNNVHHISKINQNIRFDDIVIRLYHVNDAIKLLNFIDNNNQIQKGLMEPNPFAFTHNNIAIVHDGSNSYNMCISSYILMYMQKKKEENNLNNVSSLDFANFVGNYYREVFMNKHNIEHHEKDFRGLTQSNYYENMLDIKNITEVFLKSYRGMTLSNFFEHFMATGNPFKRKSDIKELMGKVSNNTKNISVLKANKSLLLLYNDLCKCYNKDGVPRIITNFFNSNNPNYLTRKNNIRQNAIDSNMRNILYPLIVERRITIYDYIKNLEIKGNNDSRNCVTEEMIRSNRI